MMSPPAKRLARRLTTIGDLGDELLREILVRLPALPSLVRAALACRAFLRAVRCSSLSFRRRFRALHPPPVLGFFITGGRSYISAFVPLRRRNDPDLAAAVRGGDFFLTRLLDHGQGDGYIATNEGWVAQGCRNGHVLLFNQKAQQMAVYNPLTRILDLFPQPPQDEISSKFYGEIHIFSDEEKPNSFRVFGIYEDDEEHVAVFSSDSRRWQALAWPETPTPETWFSRMDLPSTMRTRGRGECYRPMTKLTAGETKDGDPCIFEVGDGTLSVWFWATDDDGIGSWVLEDKFSFKEEDHARNPWGDHDDDRRFARKSLGPPDVVTVVAAIHGFVYLHTNKHPCSFMSLCLETGELCKLNLSDKRSGSQTLHPYIMAWPPSMTNIKKMEEENMGKLAPQGSYPREQSLSTLTSAEAI